MRAKHKRGLGAALAAAAMVLTSNSAAAAQGTAGQAPAAAPERQPRPIAVGETISSSLATGSGRSSDTFRLRLQANQAVRIDMDAAPAPATASEQEPEESFDTYLQLRSTPEGEPFAMNDDRGDGTLNSRIIFTAPATGDYFVVASPLLDGEGGNYTLRVTELPPPPPPVALTGEAVRGELTAGSAETEIFGSAVRYMPYFFEGRRGERVQIDLSSNGEQRMLELVAPDGRTLLQDTGHGEMNARILTELPAMGRYIVRVQAPGDRPVQYVVGLRRGSAPPLVPPQQLRVGESVDGALSLQSQALPAQDQEGLTLYSLYALPVRPGQPVTVRVEANGFTPMIEGGTMSVLGFDPVTPPQAGEPATLVLQPVASGTAYIRVRSAGPGIGTFRLTILQGDMRFAD